MNFKKNKKGSHVGIILSFTLFITFLIFIFIIIGPPTNLTIEKNELIPILERSILEKISEEIITIRIYDKENLTGCVQTSIPENDFTNPTFLVFDSDLEEIASDSVSSQFLLEGGRNFTKIHFSNGSFSQNQELSIGGCTDIGADSITREERITEKLILNLMGEIQTEYDEIKNNLGISIQDEINLLFDYLNGTRLGIDTTKPKSNVYAETIKIDYLNPNAEEKIGEIIIQIW